MMDRPSPEQLRTMGPRELREQFEFGLEECKRMIVEQRIRDDLASPRIDPIVARILTNMLFLITGRVE